MGSVRWLMVLSVGGLSLALASEAYAQAKPYIGLVYPAGGQQGMTFQVEVAGQNVDNVNAAVVSGSGVQAEIIDFHRRLGPLETQLLNEELRELRQKVAKPPSAGAPPPPPATVEEEEAQTLITKIEKRLKEVVNTPAAASLANIVWVRVTIASDASPGPRELRIITPHGVSNPLVFEVGQLSEICRKPMLSASQQILGKEELALRKRPDDEIEQRITLPCTVNGQIASGEVNRYRFEARKGQRLVLWSRARQLIPYIADAVPGWFQPVMALYDGNGKELAYDDDYRFKPDPIIFFEVPQDGEYVFTITDAIFRGREDFVYRVTVGELPFVTSIFPLGARVGEVGPIAMAGWNLDKAELGPPAPDAGPGIQWLTARRGEMISNQVPFALDTLPECLDKEPNDDPASAQKVELPIIVNGRIDHPDDWDVFQFEGHAGDPIVAEVFARRLDSPLDSILELTDSTGKLLALSDDREDLGSGLNTHHADSYFLTKLPTDGTYFLRLGDTARHGGEDHAYRLRVGVPQPDFALRAVPSSITFRSKATAVIDVRVIRKDGFTGPIGLTLKDPPEGFTAAPVKLGPTQETARLIVKTTLVETKQPVTLCVQGTAKIDDHDVVRPAVPAEDRMQAFLWRHLVPAQDLQAMVWDPNYKAPPKRVRPVAKPDP